MGSIMLGICIKLFLYPELDWAPAFMIGAIVSATDPVAVVALLKSLGASTKFQTLIEGESLFNDGTAMVFFILFASMTKGEEATAFGVVSNFLLLAVGGPLLGFVFGMIASLWLKRIINDDILIINITFVMCYLLFYVAENFHYEVSGILALVTLGLFMSAFGKTNIISESEHAVHTVWGFA
jgi:NhaP-type Na+/H+ or K+/H+ antiporter